MHMARVLVLASLLCCMTLVAGAAWAGRGVIAAGEPAHVASVEVIEKDAKAPAAFAEGLRLDILREASLYGAAGRPLALRIEVSRVHIKNPVGAMLIGDNNNAQGRVTVVDAAAGQSLGTFKISVDAERDRGASFGLMLIGALDPTGYADLGITAAGAVAASGNRSGTEAAMSANFAIQVLRRTFGDATARDVHQAARKARPPPTIEGAQPAPAPSPPPQPVLPASPPTESEPAATAPPNAAPPMAPPPT